MLGPGERASVGTGIAVEIPDGHAGLVLPRSGLAARHGIALVNAPGLIDSGYRGELRVLLLNTDRAETFEIAPGDRIAQLLVTPFAAVEPVEAAELRARSAGRGRLRLERRASRAAPPRGRYRARRPRESSSSGSSSRLGAARAGRARAGSGGRRAGVLGQQRAVQVGADQVPAANALEPVAAVVAVTP